MKGQDVLFSSKSDEWVTPQSLFDELNDEFSFTLDAAATYENTKCRLYYGKHRDRFIDGLDLSWHHPSNMSHVVWCNPPYGNIKEWVKKAAWESISSDLTSVLLLPARTDTKWFHEYIYKSNREIRFIKGRLRFSSSKNSAPFPSMIVVFRPTYEGTK